MRNLKNTTFALTLILAITFAGLSLAPAGAVAAQAPCGDTVTVQPGDTLWTIARICQTTVARIMAANPGITNPNAIFAGQVLQMPQPDAPTPPPEGFVYTVQPGEWLAAIARRHGVSLSTLIAANPQLDMPSRIVPGQQIVIPATEQLPELGPTPPTRGITYTVQRGDWLMAIARRFGVSLSSLLAANPQLVTPSRIFPGQQIIIPLTEEQLPETGEALFTEVLIYLVAVGDEGERGLEFGCADSLIPYLITIEPTVAPLTAALEHLLAQDDTTYGDTGLYNSLAHSDLQVAGVNIVNRTAIVALTGTVIPSGVCDYPRIEYQLTYTALQFDTVDAVEITVDGTPLDDILDQR